MELQTRDDDGALLTERDAADLLKISTRTLQAWRCAGSGPSFIRVGRSIRYRRLDVLNWLQSRLVQTR